MRIGVDLRVLASGRRTGIEEYTIGLLEALLPLGQRHQWTLFYNGFRKPPFAFDWARWPWVRVAESRIPNRPFMLTATYARMPSVNRILGQLDLFFAPHFFPVSVSGKTKLVVTFHDLSFTRHPEFFSAKKLWWHWLSKPRWQAERAHHLITVSESSRADLAGLYGVAPERVSVIHSGVGGDFKPIYSGQPGLEAVRRTYRLPRRFVLYFGTIEPRKNIIAVVQAFERAVGGGYPGALVIAGMPGWSCGPILKAYRRSPFAGRIIFTGAIPAKDKAYLFNLAECFVYPSFFEGFGFPPLEAMACGVPVITARGSSLPEVVGDAAVLVDPQKPEELSWAIMRLAEDKGLCAFLVQQGLRRARQFSWRKTALSTLQLFENLV